MRIAYLMNEYPAPSLAFVRREIHALEGLGARVTRYAARTWKGDLVDPADREEAKRTRILTQAGILAIARTAFCVAVVRPAHFMRALSLALRTGWRSRRGVIVHLAYLAEATLLLRWTREEGAEHVHAHFGRNGATIAMLCRALGGPSFSFAVHGPEEFDDPNGFGLSEKIERARFVVAISSFSRGQLFRWCDHHHWTKIHIVHCGVGREFLEARRPPLPSQARMLCIGRLVEQKGQLLLIEAMAELARKGIDLELRLIGDGPLRKPIEDLVLIHRLEGRVHLLGWAGEEGVRRELAAARIMVLPSLAEGLPVVIMEALALGRPVISTYTAGIPELVEPGVTGWLVPPGSAPLLASAMRSALEAPLDQLAEMGRIGAERVKASHDARTEAKRLLDLFSLAERQEV